MMGFGTRKKTEVTPVVIEPSLQQQLATAEAKVNECNEAIGLHDASHIQFAKEFAILTDDFAQASGLLRNDFTEQEQVEIRDRFNLFRQKRCVLEQSLHRALANWADLKQRVEQPPSFALQGQHC